VIIAGFCVAAAAVLMMPRELLEVPEILGRIVICFVLAMVAGALLALGLGSLP
jgi:hypothetical protein